MAARPAKRTFIVLMAAAASVYPLALAAFLTCTALFPRSVTLWEPWASPAIRHAAGLSLGTSIVSALVSLVVAVPCGYVLSRYRFVGARLLDLLLYLPIVLPPLVIGVSLLVFFQTPIGIFIEEHILTFTFGVPGLVLAQTVVAAAFAVRLAKLAFDGASVRRAGIARTLGATRWQSFWHVELSEAKGGLLEAFVLAWATAFGAFGPVILFCGTTRMRTEVLSTSIFLEFSVGNLDRALILSIWMGAAAAVVLFVTRGMARKSLW